MQRQFSVIKPLGNTISQLNMKRFLFCIGEGTFGSVYLVKRTTDGNYYALKRVKMNTLSEKDK